MRRRTTLALSAAVVAATTSLSLVPAQGTAPHSPNSITAVTSTSGPGVGEVTLNWTEDGTYTTGFVLETGLTTFSKTNTSMPVSGRNATFFPIPGTARTLTLTADQVAQAGAPVASGNHLYYRLSAVNQDAYGVTATHYYPYLEAVLPRPLAPRGDGPTMRVASFNVRTVRATTDAQTWLQRAPEIASEIMAYNPGVVALQELGPGRADGGAGSLDGTMRQTDSLLQALDSVYGEKYDLVRTTPYVAPGIPNSTQGMRILYDNTRYTLLSSCPEKTGTASWSSSCMFDLPILATDDETARRHAAYAEFRDQGSGHAFWFVSTHLDARHNTDPTIEASYNTLRASQADTIATKMAAMNPDNLPVIVAGDFNSWQNNRIGNGPHDALIDRGYYDTSAAVTRTNFQYPTTNEFVLTMVPSGQNMGTRIDMIFIKGARGAAYYENVMKVTDPARPSDHNMIVADIKPFDPWLSAATRNSHRAPGGGS